MTPTVALILCAILVVFAFVTVVAIRIDKHRNTCPQCKKPLIDWTQGELPFGFAGSNHLYCQFCDAYFVTATLSAQPASPPRYIRHTCVQQETTRTRWIWQTEKGNVEAVRITKPDRFQPYPTPLKFSPQEFEKLAASAQFLERYRTDSQPELPPDAEKFHLIWLNGKCSAIPVECQEPEFLAWLELLHKNDVPLRPLWRLELDGQPIAELTEVDMDWPWYTYEIVPLTEMKDINACLKTSAFFDDNDHRLNYRLIETNELAEMKPLCHVQANHVRLRGLYLKAPKS